MKKYILLEDKKTYRVEPDVSTWAAWYENPDNRVLYNNRSETHRVSTIFLGFDHAYEESGKPILFETMVFIIKDGKMDWGGAEQERYTSAEEATKGHKQLCEKYNVTTTL